MTEEKESMEKFWKVSAITFTILFAMSLTLNFIHYLKPSQNIGNLDYLTTTKKDNLISQTFAQCLTDSGAIFYGAYWCPHCKTQKEMFGEDIRFINYFECEDDKDTCIKEGVKAYPTWKIKGQLYEGVQSPERLSELTGCSLV